MSYVDIKCSYASVYYANINFTIKIATYNIHANESYMKIRSRKKILLLFA